MSSSLHPPSTTSTSSSSALIGNHTRTRSNALRNSDGSKPGSSSQLSDSKEEIGNSNNNSSSSDNKNKSNNNNNNNGFHSWLARLAYSGEVDALTTCLASIGKHLLKSRQHDHRDLQTNANSSPQMQDQSAQEQQSSAALSLLVDDNGLSPLHHCILGMLDAANEQQSAAAADRSNKGSNHLLCLSLLLQATNPVSGTGVYLFDVNAQEFNNGYTPLHLCVMGNVTEAFQLLFETRKGIYSPTVGANQ